MIVPGERASVHKCIHANSSWSDQPVTVKQKESAMADRTYQVVIWGGTGFVGKLVAEHIARDYAVRT